MKVVVEILTRTLFYIQVENDATVLDLKRAIEAQEKHQHDRLILMFKGALTCIIMNKDDSPLTSYGVGDNSHIYLLFCPLPPPPHPHNDNDDGFLPHFLWNSLESMGSDQQHSPFTGSSGQSE
ncbi:hypothetical protein Leryth_013474 [Lithospermum erythrorhizon]|uniref:Ubiquitin-like domain-containing protein n=1 Tax=Lithospermum erythrorhizon TaxID=34254 RepID=A0AAV3PVJ8_LITER|nr:hypothetical protein Leryth_013474 [Lithospermum erythrorhizon]